MKSFLKHRCYLVIKTCLIALFVFSSVSADVSLYWDAPQKFTNGERLNPSKDLKGYKLYYGKSVEDIKTNMVFLEPLLTSLKLSTLNLKKLDSSLIYFSMTSVLHDGTESELTPPIFYLP